MTSTVTEKPRTETYAEKVEGLLASSSPVRLIDRFAEYLSAAESRRR